MVVIFNLLFLAIKKNQKKNKNKKTYKLINYSILCQESSMYIDKFTPISMLTYNISSSRLQILLPRVEEVCIIFTFVMSKTTDNVLLKNGLTHNL